MSYKECYIFHFVLSNNETFSYNIFYLRSTHNKHRIRINYRKSLIMQHISTHCNVFTQLFYFTGAIIETNIVLAEQDSTLAILPQLVILFMNMMCSKEKFLSFLNRPPLMLITWESWLIEFRFRVLHLKVKLHFSIGSMFKTFPMMFYKTEYRLIDGEYLMATFFTFTWRLAWDTT